MKKFLLVVVSFFLCLSAFSQNKETHLELGFGTETGIPLTLFKDGYNVGYGLSGKAAYKISSGSAITLQLGYLSFVAHQDYHYYAGWALNTSFNADPAGFILMPFKTGFRFHLSSVVYAEPQLGLTTLTANRGGKFTFAFNGGVKIKPGFDISARYEEITSPHGSLSFVGISAGYFFRFKK